MPTILWFQLLQCENPLLFSDLYHSKLSNMGFGQIVRQNKTWRHQLMQKMVSNEIYSMHSYSKEDKCKWPHGLFSCTTLRTNIFSSTPEKALKTTKSCWSNKCCSFYPTLVWCSSHWSWKWFQFPTHKNQMWAASQIPVVSRDFAKKHSDARLDKWLR